MAELFSFPAMMGGGAGEPITVPDAAAYRRIIEATLDQFRARGWVRSQVDSVQAVPTAGGTGFVVVEFSRYRGDGSLLDSGRATYATLLAEGRWTLIGAMGS